MNDEDMKLLQAKEDLFVSEIRALKQCTEKIQEHNEKQDAKLEELKGFSQEIAAHQQITHTDMVVMKDKVSNIDKTVERLDKEIHNGFAEKIMNRANENTKELTGHMINMMERQNKQINEMNVKMLELANQKSLRSYQILAIILGSGGIIGLLLKAIIG